MNASLNLTGLERQLAGTRFAGRGQFHHRVLSTNDTLQDLARSGARDGTFVLAGEQSSGRGRRGSHWVSGPGLGLYLSVLFRPDHGQATHWTLGAAVAACDACRAAGAVETTIKWPNDLLVHRRKLAGILVDARSANSTIRDLVIGLGVNVHHDAEQLRQLEIPEVTSLRCETGTGIAGGRLEVAGEFLQRLESVADRLESGDWAGVAADWLERSPSARDTRVTVSPENDAPWSGISAGLAPDGALLVRDAGGRVEAVHQVDSVRFGEAV